MSGNPTPPVSETNEISLVELGRLIRILGMLGSAHDGEVLAAAKKAQEWVTRQSTTWEVLLTPEPDTPVASVAAAGITPADLDAAYRRGVADGALSAAAATQSDLTDTYNQGFQAGFRDAKRSFAPNAHANAQAQGSPHTTPGGAAGAKGGVGAGAAQAAPGGPGWGGLGGGGPGGLGSLACWQAAAQALLEDFPDVLRGSKEADFVAGLLAKGWTNLTTKQEAWLRDIAARAGLAWP